MFPVGTPNLASQLHGKALRWTGYLDDMGTACRHPAVGAKDNTQQAKVGDQYATRHSPFVYFHSIIDDATYCKNHVLPLTRLTTALKTVATTPSFSYLTPSLCNDGHDAPCVDGRPGGLAWVNAWMKYWVPKILASPAYQKDGMLVITAVESDGPQSDASACCGEGPSTKSPLPDIVGLGGGKIGALVLSKWTTGGTWSTTPYNHHGLLASVEDVWRLPYAGYAAAPGLNRFGLDVYNNGWETG